MDRDAAALREEALALHERHRTALMAAMRAELPDRDAVRTHFDAAHAAMSQAHWLAMDAALGAAAVLTPEQRALAKRLLTIGCGHEERCQGGMCGEGRREAACRP